MDIPGMGFFNNLSEKGIKQTISDKIDETTRAVLAGISPKEARALLRGEASSRSATLAGRLASFLLRSVDDGVGLAPYIRLYRSTLNP